MQYRRFGRTGKEVSLLGFGCMRLPIVDSDPGNINEEMAIAMIRKAIDAGVNYVDTAYPYHKGNSELLTAKALKDGYRKRTYLATKLPTWLVESDADVEKYLDEQLQKLETDHIDFYLIHNLNKDTWKRTLDHNIIPILEKARDKGKIGHIGFSFHDRLPLFKEIMDYYPWEFTQIQLNYMDEQYQAGLEGMKYAAEKDAGIVIMEPLRGGKLTKNVPLDVMQVWNRAATTRTPAEWALRWVFDFPEVGTALSGMTTMEHVEENLAIAKNAVPESLTPQEKALVDEVKEIYREKIKVMCTDCGYCIPCPEGVDIPSIFGLYNDASAYDTVSDSRRFYGGFYIDRNRDASQCIECQQCITACPQGLAIVEHLKEAHKTLTGK